MCGHTDLVEALIKFGADVLANGREQYTALHWAARKGYITIALMLLENGAQSDCRTAKGLVNNLWLRIGGSVINSDSDSEHNDCPVLYGGIPSI